MNNLELSVTAQGVPGAKYNIHDIWAENKHLSSKKKRIPSLCGIHWPTHPVCWGPSGSYFNGELFPENI